MAAESTTPPAGPDWGIGHYEETAAQILPVAEDVVARAAIGPGERVVDLGCGTGNASLLAAARGARVTGVDPAARLLEVARREAAARGLDATFVSGHAAAIPLEDGAADAVLSVFGVIFAPDAVPAVAEMARVTAPQGRIVLSAWIPEGAFFELLRMRGEVLSAALGTPPGPPPFAWHEEDALARLFAPHGFHVAQAQGRLPITAASARAYLDRHFTSHPLSIATVSALRPLGLFESFRDRAIEILEAGNESPGSFRVTSRYIVATARR